VCERSEMKVLAHLVSRFAAQRPTRRHLDRRVGLAAGPLPALQSRSSPRCSHFASRHPQLGQREELGQLGGVFLQVPVPDLGEAELLRDLAERMLDLGADTGLEALDLVSQGFDRVALAQCPALASTHGHMPGDAFLGVRPLARALI